MFVNHSTGELQEEFKPLEGQTNEGLGADIGNQGSDGKDMALRSEDKSNNSEPKDRTNPFRNLGSAAEKWEARLETDQEIKETTEPMKQDEHNDERIDGEDLRFTHQDEDGDKDAQIQADATEEQAQLAAKAEETMEQEELEDPFGREDKSKEEDSPCDRDTKAAETSKIIPDKALNKLSDSPQDELEKIEVKPKDESIPRYQQAQPNELPRLNLPSQIEDREEKERLRSELTERIQKSSQSENFEADISYGRKMWSDCENLTGRLSGELAEQLRMILEPTQSSKLGGEFRSGKRINMRKVISYVASHFRKDKIWMRRTIPDKRRYQVLLAIDDSRSMAETMCGTFALEALTLISTAMTKLEVGDLGVARFGGAIGAEILHPLGSPFTPEVGASIMSKLRFSEDNTINDRPMVELLTSINRILEEEGSNIQISSQNVGLKQLVIMLADGRFHEKDALHRAVRYAMERSEALYAFIVLDNPENSILETQTVSFQAGKPVFTGYMDDFPFPLYVVLQDIHSLPHTLADLLRQWMQFQSIQ